MRRLWIFVVDTKDLGLSLDSAVRVFSGGGVAGLGCKGLTGSSLTR